MRTTLTSPRPGRSATRAFSLIELLVAVSIMIVIVFALYQIFNQTQRALRSSIVQVDVLESGRAALEMIGRELEQLTASDLHGATNLYAGMIPVAPVVQLDIDEQNVLRTNILQEVYFLTRHTNRWYATGYRVLADASGVGSLHRFTVSTNIHHLSFHNMSGAYFNEPITNRLTGILSTNFHRVADGVIHFRLAAYDPRGERMGYETTNWHGAYRILRQNIRQEQLPVLNTNNVILRQEIAQQTKLIFLSNALPAYLDLEFAVLEPETLEQFQAIAEGSALAARDFLKKRANKVHLFRQRIPIRTAYP